MVQTGDRPDLVLLPGFMCDDGLWSRLTGLLDPHAVLHFADLSRDASISAMAERMLEEMPPRFAALGFSMGGFVAREMALSAPERITKLILVGSSARGSTNGEVRRNQGLVRLTREHGFKGLADDALRAALHPDREDDETLMQIMRDMALRLGGDAFINQLQTERVPGYARLPEIRCPTLVVWPRQDRLRALDESRALADGIPDARLEILEDCGHMVPLEAPDRLSSLVVDFLA